MILLLFLLLPGDLEDAVLWFLLDGIFIIVGINLLTNGLQKINQTNKD